MACLSVCVQLCACNLNYIPLLWNSQQHSMTFVPFPLGFTHKRCSRKKFRHNVVEPVYFFIKFNIFKLPYPQENDHERKIRQPCCLWYLLKIQTVQKLMNTTDILFIILLFLNRLYPIWKYISNKLCKIIMIPIFYLVKIKFTS